MQTFKVCPPAMSLGEKGSKGNGYTSRGALSKYFASLSENESATKEKNLFRREANSASMGSKFFPLD